MTHFLLTSTQLILLIVFWVIIIRPLYRKTFGSFLPKRRPKL